MIRKISSTIVGRFNLVVGYSLTPISLQDDWVNFIKGSIPLTSTNSNVKSNTNLYEKLFINFKSIPTSN